MRGSCFSGILERELIIELVCRYISLTEPLRLEIAVETRADSARNSLVFISISPNFLWQFSIVSFNFPNEQSRTLHDNVPKEKTTPIASIRRIKVSQQRQSSVVSVVSVLVFVLIGRFFFPHLTITVLTVFNEQNLFNKHINLLSLRHHDKARPLPAQGNKNGAPSRPIS